MIKYTVWICSVGTHKPGTIDSVILSMTRMLSRCNTADLQHRFALQKNSIFSGLMTYFNSGSSAMDKMWIFKIMRADQTINKIALEV